MKLASISLSEVKELRYNLPRFNSMIFYTHYLSLLNAAVYTTE